MARPWFFASCCRLIVERLNARAIRKGVQLEAVVEEILEGVPE